MKKLLGLAALFLLASSAFAQSKLDTPASHVQKEEQMLPPVVVTAAPYPCAKAEPANANARIANNFFMCVFPLNYES